MSDLVVVTGAFGVLGRALCTRLELAGYGVLMVDSEPAVPADWPAALETQRCVYGVDLRSAQDTATALTEALGDFGGAYALVNIAGGFAYESFSGGKTETWDAMYETNLKTAVNATQAVLPFLLERKRGRIINVGAGAAVKATTGMGAYAAAKAGVQKLTEALADELKTKNIQVNAVLPSILDTPRNRADMPDADFSTWVTADSLSKVIAFLLSAASADITGACLPVNGRV
jgi:NAD(P)-dependent dehydrogenase (short-subunit alcohol dehydrogenase family)